MAMRWQVAAIVLAAALVSRCPRQAWQAQAARVNLEVRPKYIKPCEDPRNAIGYANVTYAMVGRTVTFSFVSNITRNVARWSKVRLTADKCDEVVSPATCSHFRSMDFTDTCTALMAKNMPWTAAVAGIRPKMGCPITKGTYELHNGTLVMDIVNTIGATIRLEGPLWRCRGFFYDPKGEMHICFDAAAEFFRVRNRPG